MMSTFIPKNWRLRVLGLAVGAVITVAGMWVVSVALAQLPSFVTGFLVLALGASWCARRIDSLLWNRGSTPVRHTGLMARLRAQMDAHRALADGGCSGAEHDEPTEDDAEGTTASSLREEIYELRLALAAEREFASVLVGEFTVEQVIGEDE